MSIALGLLGLSLLGADGGGPKPEAAPITYHVRVLDMKGLAWRESLYARLKPVARRGSTTVWTAGRDVLAPLTGQAAKLVMSPQLMAQSDAAAHFSQRTSRRVASQWTRHAEGSPDHAVAVAYTPDFEEVREGCQFTLAGRSLDQGVLTRVVVDDARIAAIHQVKLTEAVPGETKDEAPSKLTPQLAVPEIVRATVEGEWLIPKGEMLVLSLGANTVDDGQGKATVRERLMLIEADPAPPAGNGLATMFPHAFTFKLPARADAEPLGPPAMPDRSLPLPRGKDGALVPLPPLPEEPVPPTALPGSDEPCATPQTRSKSDAKPEPKRLDPESTKARFSSDAKADVPPPAAPNPPLPMFPPARNTFAPVLFRVPLGNGLTIEVRASYSPLAKP